MFPGGDQFGRTLTYEAMGWRGRRGNESLVFTLGIPATADGLADIWRESMRN